MSSINTIAEQSNFTEETESQDDSSSNSNFDKDPNNTLSKSLFVSLCFNAKIHFLLNVCQVICGVSLLINDVLSYRS